MRIGVIGAGNMATGLARGFGEPLLVSDPVAERAEALAAEVGGEVVGTNTELAERADIVVLCHKPAQLEEVAEEARGGAEVVVSILAATPVEAVEAAYPGRPVYRFMPNMAAEVRQGVFCYVPGSLAGQGPEAEVRGLFERCGTVIDLDESLFGAATAVMSSGMAFIALAGEALAESGARHGLEPDLSARMVVETMAGTAAVLRERGDDTRELRRRVTSPGGLTEKGIAVLEDADIRAAFDGAVDAVVGGKVR